ncbi:MAG: proline--tRNA ligase [Proteobacteria bacterium]|nr:proline--tRNA ligase [Pseudomonadota bacterium]
MGRAKTAITPTRTENYPEWYQQVVRAADLAETSPVRGCMVIKPWGYALWENMQRRLDAMFKETGHKNAYFPLFIPLSFLEKEAQHVQGFAKECAVVTHHRLEAGPDGTLIPSPSARLQEPLVVRPTSETIIGAAFAKWVESYRDLPLLINQWANVVRWEMRTRMFLRTTEFLWQEGHTAHATREEACEETQRMLHVYAEFAERDMAMPVVKGAKSERERFPGAVQTYAIEAMMQDRKALQAGTSHFLGQNFARASDIKFLDREGALHHAWTTSWGATTRLVGGLVMTHADDDGLVLPPRLAPSHVVILPITIRADDPQAVMNHCWSLRDQLRSLTYGDRHIEVDLDDRDLRGGDKVWSWIKKGIPIRLEVGPREASQDAASLSRRDRSPKERRLVSRSELAATLPSLLQQVQDGMLERAKRFRQQHTCVIDKRQDFADFYCTQGGEQNAPSSPHGGFALTHWSGDRVVEEELNRELSVSLRCIPLPGQLAQADGPGRCPFSGKPSKQRVVWARAY